jgi:hypothetical protein
MPKFVPPGEVCPPCRSLYPLMTDNFAKVCFLPQYLSHFWSDFCQSLSTLAEVCPPPIPVMPKFVPPSIPIMMKFVPLLKFVPSYFAKNCPPCQSLSKSFFQSLSSRSYSPLPLLKVWRVTDKIFFFFNFYNTSLILTAFLNCWHNISKSFSRQSTFSTFSIFLPSITLS